MPVIKVNDQQFSLRPGPNRLGAGDGVDVPVGGSGPAGVQAIVDVSGDNHAVIRRAGDGAGVRVNGVPLVDPTPLMHGDKLEIGGRELFYTDDDKSGATQFVSASDIAAMAAKRAGPARATAATGGRLVSLVDGKEYNIPATGITIGRDASCGVVVAKNEVSRKHSEIAPVEGGYEVRDFSANGVFVNGVKIDKPQILSRADVIAIGGEEFRFYADVATAAPVAKAVASPPAAAPPAAAPPVAAPVAPPVAAPVAPPAPPAAAAPPVAPPRPAVPPPAPVAPVAAAAPAPPAASPAAVAEDRPVLAVLEVAAEGPTKGSQFEIRVPLAHIGRGAHNDVVINDDSVSDTHAKLQRRDDGWYVVDVGSTNGTYVGGQRISGERRLDGAPDVRFGGIRTVFRARDSAADAGKATRAIAAVDRSKLRPTTASAPAPAPQQTATVAEPKARSGLPGWVWGVVVLAIGAAVAFFLLNR